MSDKPKPRVDIWTDGGGVNTGNVGAAAVMYGKGKIRVLASGIGVDTNNVAETVAVLIGLKALLYPSQVVIHTDSQYVFYGLRRLKKGSMLDTNVNWWKEIQEVIKKMQHDIDVVMVTGHKKKTLGDDILNNLADAWADHIAKTQGEPYDQRFDSLQDAIDNAPKRVVKSGQEVKVNFDGYRYA